MTADVLRIGSRITCLPVVHGSGDSMLEVRRYFLGGRFDCLALPLPPSFQPAVEEGIERLPRPGIVVQSEPSTFRPPRLWSPDEETDDDLFDDDDDYDEEEGSVSYVPIDPCQPVIQAIRMATGEHLPCQFIDMEVDAFRPSTAVLPDPYALKKVRLDRFAAAVLPSIPRPSGLTAERVEHMAARLKQLSQQYESILFVCSLLEWPWVRDAVLHGDPQLHDEDAAERPVWYPVSVSTLMFLLGELPFITGLYERARAELEDDENLSIDGVKELLLEARKSYKAEYRNRARRISPHDLSLLLKYVRNLTLMEDRFTPDLFTLVTGSKQVCGDGYALHVAENASTYPYAPADEEESSVDMGLGEIRLPDGAILEAYNRLPGPPMTWRSCQLVRRPDRLEQQRWETQWNPFAQCSWPPEDDQIESFRDHVMRRALQAMGADLVQTEKFTTSIKDGIDIRDTLRNWHTGEIYVKNLPPARGSLDCVVMLFDSPADPRDYPWRSTWHAEHENESTLALFASDFRSQMVGPGIGLANYGGAMFLFPPRPIADVWVDPRLDFAETLEERLLAAACVYSESRQIALLSAYPPGAGWRRLARRFHKRWVHVPLTQFSDSTIKQLRMVHVLNGRQVRSYASHFIRKV